MKTHSKPRIIFGGTFDPFHWGHWYMINRLLNFGYPHVHVVVAGDPYHKSERKVTPAKIRLEMVQSFLYDPIFGEGVTIEDIEVKKSGPSYTFDTVLALMKKYDNKHMSFAVGTDAVANLHRWYKAKELIEIATPLFVYRGGDNYDLDNLKPIMSDEKIQFIKDYRILQGQSVKISSTHIREKVKSGEDVLDIVPRHVIDIIEREGLYR
jgi:nicotinate-nucleotide adenylyltransferase